MYFARITGTKVAHSKHVLKLIIMCFNSYLVTEGTLTSILPSTGAIDLLSFAILSVTELIIYIL